MSHPVPAEPPTSNLRAWGTLAVLIAAYAVSFLDRQILGLLVDPLRQDLRIDNTQIGMLQGPAFGLLYAALGLPLGILADRTHRVRLMAAGIMVWSVMTGACGLAPSFGWLFAARVGVGVGEAALVPAAVSVLADLFSGARRALAMSLFTAGISVGQGLSLLLGGAFVAFAQTGATRLPLVGHWLATLHPWQIVFLLAGAVGVPLAMAMLAIPEPSRAKVTAAEATHGLFATLAARPRLFVPLLAGSSLLYLFSNATASWMPSLFIRDFGWTAAETGVRLGSLLLVCALAGNLLSGASATALGRRGRIEAPLLVMLGGAAMLVPVGALGPLAGSAAGAQAAILAIFFAIALCFGMATATFVAVTPPAVRGRMIALYLLCGNLVGLGLGPPSVGWLLDRVVGPSGHVGSALALVGLCTCVPGFLLMASLIGRYRAAALSISRPASRSGAAAG
ncbi:MFS transporter [Sphingomonas sp. CGMCC 1.13654]|uniref:MFS transporter n=1 Tax=Sphingomonas chungangi TaxID=2683589 RepID=A0A838L7A8_9SPHN|nr:MFS transporter [Sphingomonas chungangi]MBA2934810.1 MFS transporter [Sphingomonas chungangi]MVW58121.1 MFS transporter [Sphingomonas chungangi]